MLRFTKGFFLLVNVVLVIFFSAMAFKKVSIIPIIENGMSKEPEEIEPPTLTIYKYTPCSIKGFLFYLTTILAMIILGNQI